MPVTRLLPTSEATDLLALTRDIAARELAPYAGEYEEAERFPREALRTLGRAGLLGLPYPVEYGGGEQPYEVYLQVLEELAASWMSVAVGVSVHALSCYPLVHFGTEEQRRQWLPDLLSGELLGAYALSEQHAGSDAAALSTRAAFVPSPRTTDGGHYRISGQKAWTTHGGVADYYTLMARTSDDGAHGISCFLIEGGTPGLSPAPPERKMGLTASPTTQLNLEDVAVPEQRRVGTEGQGLKIALSALDSGRLGIAACAVGLARAALDLAVNYADQREQFGQTVMDFQGVQFLLADMAAAVESARATYLRAARLRDAGEPFTRQAAIAKLVATDAAMKVTTDAVQVLGGAGYTRDFPAERYLREAKVLQIFEGTNQIQRSVIARHLRAGS